jgi:DNA-binding transcriptional MocR family regulator
VALSPDVRAVILQPRAQNPAGSAMTVARAAALAGVLADGDAIVIEDDHANDISAAPLVSIGRWLAARTVHVRGYSKSHGPDLRLAAVGGAGDVVTAVANRRLLGPGWSSRILQALLVELLQDPATPEVMRIAAETYARRRAIVTEVLDANGVAVSGTDGINLWMRVADERSATVALAAGGIGVAPGGPFLVRPDDDHLRVTVGLITGPDDHVADVATRLAAAAARSLPGRRSHHR